MQKITVIAIGNKMPSWVAQATQEFVTRLKDNTLLHLVEIPLLHRGKSSDSVRTLEKETKLIEQQIPNGAHIIAMDVKGASFSSEKLASKISQLQHINSHVCFLLGGPEGLSPSILAQCHETWSLSSLTLPHTLARIVLLEALYRAFCILNNHPYHK